MIVVEKDTKLASLLSGNLSSKIKIINEDILKIDENNIDDKELIVFGNLPYNISTEIISKWIINIKE